MSHFSVHSLFNAGGDIELTSSNVTNPVSQGSWVKGGHSGSFRCRESRLIAAPNSNSTLFAESGGVALASGVAFTLCTVKHLKLASHLKEPMKKMAVRNSNFTPALDSVWQPWKRCHELPWINDEDKGCDRRIENCRNGTTGGVVCFCGSAEAGLHFAGPVDDGGSCKEPTTAQLDMQTNDLDLTIRKPSPSSAQKMLLSSRGDTEVDVSFLFYEFQGSLLQQVTGEMELLGSSNGLHVMLLPPETVDDETIHLKGQSISPKGLAKRLASHIEFSFNCSLGPNTSVCARDGDIARTVFSMRTTNEKGQSQTSNVTVTGRVEALPSCELVRSHVTINPDVRVLDHMSKEGLTISIALVDVDSLPLLFTNPALDVQWGQTSDLMLAVPYQREKAGSNVFKSVISADRFSQPGAYKLRVRLREGWSSARHKELSCDVLDRAVEVSPLVLLSAP